MNSSEMLRLWLVLCAAVSTLAAAAPSFRRDVQPILESRCGACHSSQLASGGVNLAAKPSRAALVVAGRPDRSKLVEVISGPSPRMPKSGQPLKPEEIATIRLWIETGALDDSPENPAGERWWSLRPISPPPAPGPGHPIDEFVLAKLQEKGLAPSPAAGKRVLIRRLTYDLHGLPPTPEEVDAFLADSAPDAYGRLVDRLLASPRYGERWARHWLDTVHYGESHGFDKDKPRRNAWPYRDYVIDALNQDMPFARFVLEQIAGDVLFPTDPKAVAATGFLAAGPWDYVGHAELREGTTDKAITRNLDRDDIVMTVMSTFASTTVHCARCHNHKFDPIPQADYYSLQAVFAGIDRADRPYDDDPALYRRRLPLLAGHKHAAAEAARLQSLLEQLEDPALDALDEELKGLRAESGLLFKTIAETEEGPRKVELEQQYRDLRTRIEEKTAARTAAARDRLAPEQRSKLEAAEAALKSAEQKLASLPPPNWVYAAASDFPRMGNFRPAYEPRPVYLLNRGSVESPGPLMTPGALSAVDGLPARFRLPDPSNEGARRAALGMWLIHPRNPLTWRSIVNRVWHYHFGQGLVDTPNDFGRMGSQPTHPELLDWLAARFRDSGGSLKSLHRLIVTSAAYRQSSGSRPDAEAVDAGNQFLWRMNRQRLDAESTRDATLYIASRLDFTRGGPSAEQFFFKDDHSPVYDYSRFDPEDPANFRRSIYRFLVRSVPDPFMESLDCPDPSLLTPKRNNTLTAVQALALLNDSLMVHQAEHWARRLQEFSPRTGEQIRQAYRLALSREPTLEELDLLVAYAGRHGLANVCRTILNSNEFVFID